MAINSFGAAPSGHLSSARHLLPTSAHCRRQRFLKYSVLVRFKARNGTRSNTETYPQTRWEREQDTSKSQDSIVLIRRNLLQTHRCRNRRIRRATYIRSQPHLTLRISDILVRHALSELLNRHDKDDAADSSGCTSRN